MKKIVILEKYGNAFWLEGDIVFYAPLNEDGSIAMEEGGEVENWDEVNEKEVRFRLA